MAKSKVFESPASGDDTFLTYFAFRRDKDQAPASGWNFRGFFFRERIVALRLIYGKWYTGEWTHGWLLCIMQIAQMIRQIAVCLNPNVTGR